MKMKKYIVLGLTPQGLAILRELGRAGVKVIAFCQSTKNVGYHSRYGKKIVFHEIDELKEHISNIVEKCEEKPVCYITSGEILALVLREYKELYEICEVSSRPYSVIEMLAHKDKMYEYALAHGMVTAQYATLDDPAHKKLTFPLFLKRNYEIPLFFKAVKINSAQELQSYVQQIPCECLQDVIAQEFIDIPNNRLLNLSCQGYYVEGICCGLYLSNQKRRLKKGITSYIEEFDNSDIGLRVMELCKKFMFGLKYCGFAEFEFMYDIEKQNLYFIEVNTRTCGLQSSLHYKFSNVSEVLVHPDQAIKLKAKVEKLRWMNIVRDIRARIQSRDFTNLTDIFRSQFDILAWDDLKPFIFQFLR